MSFRDDVETLMARREALRERRRDTPDDPQLDAEWDALCDAIDATRTGRAQSLLDGMKIAKPCPASWAAMAGGDHVRACTLCDKRVYQLSGLTAVEALALLTDGKGRVCVRLYRRRDGSVMTADCKEGTKRRRRRALKVLGVAAGVVAGVAASKVAGPALDRAEAEHARRMLWDGSVVMGEAPTVEPDRPPPWYRLDDGAWALDLEDTDLPKK